jgi:hypothetical protein
MNYCPKCGKPVTKGAQMDTRECLIIHFKDERHSWIETLDKYGGPTIIKEDE